MSSFVYLLRHESEPRFKIGKANDIEARVRQLGHTTFNFKASRALEATTERMSHHIERLLHRLFAEFRLKPCSTAAARYPTLRPGDDGSTEWFDMSCWDRLTRFLADNRDLLRFVDVASDVLHGLGDALRSERDEARRVRQTAAYQMAVLHQRVWDAHDIERGKIREQIAQSLRKLREGCSFVSVMSTKGQMLLVGTGPRSRAKLTTNQLDVLARALVAFAPAVKMTDDSQWATDRSGAIHFSVPLPGEPGDSASCQAWQRNWTDEMNSLFWGITPEIPGFDVLLRLDEMQQAAAVYAKAHNDKS